MQEHETARGEELTRSNGATRSNGLKIEIVVDGFTRYLSVERGFSDNTVRSYRSDLDQLAQFARSRGVVRADELSLELFRDWLWEGSQAGLAAATLARRSAAARGLSSWLATHHGTTDVGARLKAPKPGQHLPRVLTRAQIDSILGSLTTKAETGDVNAVRDLAVVELLYASALRV